jgi:hypothetical protein
MEPSRAPYCRYCGHLDQTRSVRAIYDAGTRHIEGATGTRWSQTRLAARLAPPPRPQRRGAGCGCGWLVVLALALLALRTLVPLPVSLTPDTELLLVLVALVAFGMSRVAGWLRQRWAFQRELQAWEVDLITWRQTYYCGRCDVTFIPVPSTAAAFTGQTVRLRS